MQVLGCELVMVLSEAFKILSVLPVNFSEYKTQIIFGA